jgi:glutathione S-transferase
VEKALELKGIPYKVFEWTPPTHAVGQRLIFGGRTVPGIRFEGGERVLGSLARQIFQPIAGRVPAGTIPAAWLPATPVAA